MVWVRKPKLGLTRKAGCDLSVQGSGKGEAVELRDCPLEMKEWEGPECPRFTGVLKRGDTEVGGGASYGPGHEIYTFSI